MNDLSLRRLVVTPVNEGSESFTCHRSISTCGMSHACFYSLGHFVIALLAFDGLSSVLSVVHGAKPTDWLQWEDRLRNDLFCVQ